MGGGEPVSEPTMGMDVLRSRQRVGELATQPLHVYVHRALVLAERALPHSRVQLLAGDDPIEPPDEGREEVERAAVDGRDELARPDLQVADRDDLGFLRRQRHGWFPKIAV